MTESGVNVDKELQSCCNSLLVESESAFIRVGCYC